MNKIVFAATCMAAVLLLSGCNSASSREELVATIGGTPLYRSDADFFVSMIPEGGRSPTSLTWDLQEMLDQKVRAEGARRMLGDPDGRLEAQMQSFQDRNLAQVYQGHFIGENLGVSDDSVYAFYRRNQSKYPTDSLLGFYGAVRIRVARDLYVENHLDEIKAYYKANPDISTKPATLKIAFVNDADSVKASQRLAALSEGLARKESPESILKSNVLPKWSGLRAVFNLTKSSKSEWVSDWAALQPYLFGSQPIAAGLASPIVAGPDGKGGKVYGGFHLLARTADTLMTFAEVKEGVGRYYIENVVRRKMFEQATLDLRAKYKARIVEPPLAGTEKYYELHRDEFKTQRTYHVYHIESKDSASLAAMIAGVADLGQFQAKAAELSANAQTKARKGDVGVIKNQHCLPWGIGMFPELFDLLDSLPMGAKTPVLQAPDTKMYHVFYLVEKIPAQVKAFARVRKQVEAQMLASGVTNVDSLTVLAYLGDMPVVRERDVLALRKEVPAQQQSRYTREMLVSYLLDWAVFAREARSIGMDHSPVFRQWIRLQRDRMYDQLVTDSLLAGPLGLQRDRLRKEYDQAPAGLFDKPFEQSITDVALWIRMPDISYRRAFAANPALWGASDWKAARTAIFRQIRYTEFPNVQKMLKAQLVGNIDVVIFDTTLGLTSGRADLSTMIDSATKAYEKRNLNEALEIWRTLMAENPQNDTLQQMASREVARMLNEREDFEEALLEYRIYTGLWPNAPDAYKALFMQGFILSENLKRDSLALPIFREVLVKYPKSDLADDAEWMIRNIESGGQLVPALLDSIAKADSANAQSETTSQPNPSQPSNGNDVPAQPTQPSAPPATQPVAQPVAPPPAKP